uniref:Tumor protein D52 n=1 Tax=Pavo cristatus TaxID=9049 RepID=A0A8C9G0A7_PAVCR
MRKCAHTTVSSSYQKRFGVGLFLFIILFEIAQSATVSIPSSSTSSPSFVKQGDKLVWSRRSELPWAACELVSLLTWNEHIGLAAVLGLTNLHVEEEIQTLSQVLAAKEKHLAEIKRKLGINSLQELKQNITKSWQDVTSTAAYKKTSETLSQAGQKASAAFSSVSSSLVVLASCRFALFLHLLRESSKVGGSKPASGDFGEVLNSAANASATETIAEETQEETH